MARYIDADALREYWLENGVNENVYNTNAVLNSIDYQPTADVVEVLRCEKCKHLTVHNSPTLSIRKDDKNE